MARVAVEAAQVRRGAMLSERRSSRDVMPKQCGMHGPLAARNIVDVERIDADPRCA
jgi:hypothetical protein